MSNFYKEYLLFKKLTKSALFRLQGYRDLLIKHKNNVYEKSIEEEVVNAELKLTIELISNINEVNLDFDKEYLILFNQPDENGNIYKPGCFKNLENFGLKENEIGIYKK